MTRTGESHSRPRLAGRLHEQADAPASLVHTFSLGVVFYEMLTGDVPVGRFEAPSEGVKVDVRLDRIVLAAVGEDSGAARSALAALRAEIARTVPGEHAVDDEIRHLMDAVAG